MRKMMMAAALAAATATAPALGQVGNSQGLVVVTIQDVTILDDFLNDTQIAALNNVSVLSGNGIANGNRVGVVAPVKAIVSRNGLVGGLLGGFGHGCGCN